jgi:hypothetical protein
VSEPLNPGDPEDPDVFGAELVPSEAENRAYAAHLLRMQGVSWRDVAQQVGYASISAASGAVSNYLSRAAAARSTAQAQEALQTQVDRYEAVLSHWWEAGTSGHNKDAAAVLLRTLSQLDRILRLGDNEVTVNMNTVVISADRDEYIAGLQAVVEARRRG